jgi:hypothetical protein
MLMLVSGAQAQHRSGERSAHASIEGDVYLVAQNGDVKKGPGRTVYLIRDSDSLRTKMAEACDVAKRAGPPAAPLFPARNHPDRSLTKMDASNALRRAELEAGLVKLDRGVWHPYRRLWAVQRKHLPDVDVARAGGWRDLATMKRSYQQADAATVLKVVENMSGGHIADTAPTQGVQTQ